jgi:hypothetical protein
MDLFGQTINAKNHQEFTNFCGFFSDLIRNSISLVISNECFYDKNDYEYPSDIIKGNMYKYYLINNTEFFLKELNMNKTEYNIYVGFNVSTSGSSAFPREFDWNNRTSTEKDEKIITITYIDNIVLEHYISEHGI